MIDESPSSDIYCHRIVTISIFSTKGTPMNQRTLKSFHPVAALAAILFLSGCGYQKTTQTGFLKTYDPLPAKELTTPYTKFLVDEIAYVPAESAPKKFDPVKLEKLKTKYKASLMKAFDDDQLEYATEAGPGVMRVRAAITDFKGANVWVNALALPVIGPVTAGGASTEAEVVDSVTGEPLVALATHSNGTPFLGGPQNYLAQYGHARSAVSRHAKKLHKLSTPLKPAR